MAEHFRVSTPTDNESKVYYGLWDTLSAEAKATQKAHDAQHAYGIDTMEAIALLFDLVEDDRLEDKARERERIEADTFTTRLLGRLADLPRRGERTEEGALNLAQLDTMIESARTFLGQPVRRPDYDAE